MSLYHVIFAVTNARTPLFTPIVQFPDAIHVADGVKIRESIIPYAITPSVVACCCGMAGGGADDDGCCSCSWIGRKDGGAAVGDSIRGCSCELKAST